MSEHHSDLHSMEAEAKEKRDLSNIGWVCPDCWAVNPHSATVCTCGNSHNNQKISVKEKEKDSF